MMRYPGARGEQARTKKACLPGALNLVFPNSDGKTESADNLRKRRVFPALRRAGPLKIRFHDLRHTYASLLIDHGEHPKYIQSQMEYNSTKVTMDNHGHPMNTVNREAASRLGGVLRCRFFTE